MYKNELRRVSPESVGLSSKRLLALLQNLERISEMHGIMIACNGCVVAESWWAPYTADLPHICHSLGKSYVASAVALAIQDGLLSVEDRIVDLFREDLKALGIEPYPNLNALKIKHLLTMTNGMAHHPALDEHLVVNYLSEPIVFEPGSRFMYNTAGTSMLGEVVTRLTGRSLHEYMGEKLFEPLGIERDKLLWMPYKNGLDASPGIASTTENNLRLGLLYLNGGFWNGKQLIPKSYVQDAVRTQVDNRDNPGGIEGRSGYGYQIWMCSYPGAYRFDGGSGQFTYVCPSRSMVFSINQSAMMPSGTDQVLALLTSYLEQTDDLSCSEAKFETELRQWCNSRRLQPATVTSVPIQPKILDGLYRTVKGEFHIHPEIRANDRDNLDRAFYDIEDEYCHTLSVRTIDTHQIEIVMDHLTRLMVRLDGHQECVYSKGAEKNYDITCSTGYYDGSSTLVVHTRWLQTCHTITMRLTRYWDELIIDLFKTTTHESSPEIHYLAHLAPIQIP